MNLGKRASLNMNSRTKLLQVQLKICSRFLVLFPIGYCFAGTPQFSSSTVKHYETVQLQFTSFTFLREQLGEKLCFVVFSRWMSARQLGKRARCKLQATSACKGGNFGPKLTHLCCFWSDVSFLSHLKKHGSRFWLDVSLFSRLKDILPSSDWPEIIFVWTVQRVSQ